MLEWRLVSATFCLSVLVCLSLSLSVSVCVRVYACRCERKTSLNCPSLSRRVQYNMLAWQMISAVSCLSVCLSLGLSLSLSVCVHVYACRCEKKYQPELPTAVSLCPLLNAEMADDQRGVLSVSVCLSLGLSLSLSVCVCVSVAVKSISLNCRHCLAVSNTTC